MNQIAEHAYLTEHSQVAEHPGVEEESHATADSHAEGQQHPVRIYFLVWALLFVFSIFSYLIDYFDVRGPARWTLIITFMMLKASFIVGVFMHMAWERLALKLAILVPPLSLLILIGLMAIEGDYTFVTRLATLVSKVAS
jgi:cytochrome c oxidase subunit IV